MAQRVNIETLSDLSEKPDASTVEFAVDGVSYSIDLTNDEQEKFRKVVAPYVGAARTTSRRRRSASNGSGPSAKTIRKWAQDNGHNVPDRGRVPNEVREAYASAH